MPKADQKICLNYLAKTNQKKCPSYVQAIYKICLKYDQDMDKISPRLAHNKPNICQGYD